MAKKKNTVKKKFSINVENDEVVSVEVDGIVYKDIDQIPDSEDRARAMLLMSDLSDPMELDIPAGSGIDLGKIILPLFLGVSILMLAIAAFAGFRTTQGLSREVSAQGVVVDIVSRRGQSGTFYYPVVEITLADGSRQQVPISQGSFPPAYQKGEQVVISYDPGRANTVRIRTFWSTVGQFILSIITGILGLAFLGATFFARWILKQEPSMEMSKEDREWLES